MVPTLKAEFKKLLTVRSTYIVSLLIIVMTGLFTYLGTSQVYEEPVFHEGETSEAVQVGSGTADKNSPQTPEFVEPVLTRDLPSTKLLSNFVDNISAVTLLITIVVILLMAHEFRYNTITYTLTSSNSRSRVLLAKIIAGTTYTVLLTLLVILLTIAATYLAVSIKDLNLPHQNIDWFYIIGRLLGYTLGFSLFGLALITLIRNQTAGIVAIFIVPTLDSIAAGILSIRNLEPIKYLPFSALSHLGNVAQESISSEILPTSVTRALVVVAVYLIPLWLFTWYIFLRRDAT